MPSAIVPGNSAHLRPGPDTFNLEIFIPIVDSALELCRSRQSGESAGSWANPIIDLLRSPAAPGGGLWLYFYAIRIAD